VLGCVVSLSVVLGLAVVCCVDVVSVVVGVDERAAVVGGVVETFTLEASIVVYSAVVVESGIGDVTGDVIVDAETDAWWHSSLQ